MKYPAMRTVLVLVKSPHTQAADVTRPVVTGRKGMVHNRVGTNEADVSVSVSVGVFLRRAFQDCHPFRLSIEGSGGRFCVF